VPAESRCPAQHAAPVAAPAFVAQRPLQPRRRIVFDSRRSDRAATSAGIAEQFKADLTAMEAADSAAIAAAYGPLQPAAVELPTFYSSSGCAGAVKVHQNPPEAQQALVRQPMLQLSITETFRLLRRKRPVGAAAEQCEKRRRQPLPSSMPPTKKLPSLRKSKTSGAKAAGV
ncbi:hypothetical protein BOX15_Mlig025599g1, partial [Macrostomum lignano]